jgi:hypothetical protein
MNCFICTNPTEGNFANIHALIFYCANCGNYSITDVAMNTIPKQTYPNWQSILRTHISNNQIDGVVFITTDTIKSLFGY